MTLQVVVAIAVFVGAYVFIATEKLPRVMVALGGAAAMVLIGATDDAALFFSEDTGVDWNVIFLLLGMMIIVGILRQTGLFEYLAIWSAKLARGRPFRVMVMLVVITAVLSALLDNVTTILLIAPVSLLVAQRLGKSPVPFLLAEVFASNIGGTATLIGDPPNLIIGSRGDLGFNDFIVNLAPVVVVLVVVLVGLCRVLFRSTFAFDEQRAERVMALNEKEAIRDPRLLVTSLVVVGLVLAGFVTSTLTGLAPAIVALLGAGLLFLLARLEPREVFGDVEWETLLFFGGLFVMVGSLVNIGVIDAVGEAATGAVGDDFFAASVALLLGSAVFSGIVDNIPYVATLAPLTSDLVNSGGPQAQPLWWALALGADLGGNLTAVGASANVVMIGIAKRNGHPVSFWQFTRYGIVVTAVTVGLCLPYLWLRYYL